MSTTVTNQTLKVTVSAKVGTDELFESSYSVANINEAAARKVTVPITAISLFLFGAAAAAGTYIKSDVKFIAIVNKDDSNFVRIRMSKTSGDTFDHKLEAGKVFIINNTSISTDETAAAFSAFADIDSINAQADTAPVDVEIYLASL